jgi:hypothetical protein
VLFCLSVGKKTAELKSLTAALIPAKFCFTLYSKRRGLALHLQTDSEYTREAWLKGLVQVLQSYSKRKMIAKRESMSIAPVSTAVGTPPINSLQAFQAQIASSSARSSRGSGTLKLPPPIPAVRPRSNTAM